MVRFLDLIAHDGLLACVRSLHCPPLAEWAVTNPLSGQPRGGDALSAPSLIAAVQCRGSAADL